MLKDEFKKKNITITTLSDIMDVSRPTLYKLIETFNKGKFLPPKYQDFLDVVNDESLSREETLIRLKELKRENKRSNKQAYYNRKELLANIVENAKKDLRSSDSNNEVYKFVNYLITNYKKNQSLELLSRYVLFVNNIIDEEKVEESEMMLYAAIYKSVIEYQSGSLEVDEKYLDIMKKEVLKLEDKRKKEIEKAQAEIENELKEKLKLKILAEVNKKISLGIDIDDLDLDDITKNIKF